MIRKIMSYRETYVFSASLLAFAAIIYLGVKTDIHVHADYIGRIAAGTMKPPANFLYFLTVYCTALFHTDSTWLYNASAVVLAAAVTAKFTITRNFITSCTGTISAGDRQADRLITAVAAMLMLVVNIPTGMLIGGHFYLGHITPTVWHNSTTIFLMPFALLLFWQSYEQILQPTDRRLLLITGLCILNILVKPSFFFVFCIAYPLLLLRHFGIGKRLWTNLIPVFAGAVVLLAEYVLIYTYDFGNAYGERERITVNLFSIWSHWTSNIPLALAGSLVFPLAYLLLYGKELRNNLPLQYASGGYVIAVLIFSVFSESGPRQFSGNFYWQCVVAGYILFMVAAAGMTGKLLRGNHAGSNGLKDTILRAEEKSRALLICFLLHVISGVIFLGYLISLGRTSGS